MNRLKSNLITAGIVLGTLVLLTIGFLFVPFRSNNALQASLLAYTNDISGDKLAIFVVTNVCNESVTFVCCCPQTGDLNHWPQIQLSGVATTVLAHTTTNFTMTVATNFILWRQPIFWTYDRKSEFENVQGKARENLRFNWLLISRGRMPRYFNFSTADSHMAFTTIITNK